MLDLPVRTPPAAPAAAPAAAKPALPALRLLQFEADIRRLKSEPELLFHLANELPHLLACDQVLVLRRTAGATGWQVGQVSGLPVVDRATALVRAFEARLAALQPSGVLDDTAAFDLGRPPAAATTPNDHDRLLAAHPVPQALWLPLRDRQERVDAGVLVLRTTAFAAGEQAVLQRLADTYAHAWTALPLARRLRLGATLTRRRVIVAAALLTALALLPVRLSVMAPAEVVAARPVVVTAPIPGVVGKLLVAPNERVVAGQPLVQFEDIQPRNESVLAQQRMVVAKARYERLAALAFADASAGHEMATARAEYELALLNHRYAAELLQRTRVVAPAAGVAIYADRRDWEGRAVLVGEELLQVADPAEVAYRVDLGTANLLPLAAGAEADVYLDHAPLGGAPARVRSVSYLPRTLPGGETAYTVVLDSAGGEAPRIGARGTARLYGDRVPLIVQWLRRPIVALRQTLGL